MHKYACYRSFSKTGDGSVFGLHFRARKTEDIIQPHSDILDSNFGFHIHKQIFSSYEIDSERKYMFK